MKTSWKIICIASLTLTGCATHPAVQPGPSTGALSPQQMLDNMSTTSNDAAVNCSYFYDYACQLQIRSPEMGKSLAAILRLRDAVIKYHADIAWNHEPRPDWLRLCCETLLDAWVNVELSLPQLEPPPRVVGSWNRAQDSLVAMYRASSPYIGQPLGPLPSALGGSSVQPGSSVGALSPLQEFANMHVAAHNATVNCNRLYDYACGLQVRNPEKAKALAAILRLRDQMRTYYGAVSWNYEPLPNSLRECSEQLLDAWINVEVSFPKLEATPLVADCWNRSQQSLVDLYRAASPHIGQPIAPLPLALGVKVSETR